MKIWIASDHGGYNLKTKLWERLLLDKRYDVYDLGCYTCESCDYPDYAKAVCVKVREYQSSIPDATNDGSGDSKSRPARRLCGIGILVCTTGQGMAMTANAQPGIRAALVRDVETAKLSREHNNANVICIGSKFTDCTQAAECVQAFIETSFSKEPRHDRRVQKIKN